MAYSHKAKAGANAKKIKEQAKMIKEIFRFRFRFRSVWMGLNDSNTIAWTTGSS